MSEDAAVPRRRKALREENARLRAQLQQSATDLDGLALQVSTLRGEHHEVTARLLDAEQALASGVASVTAWRRYAEAILRTTVGLQQWIDWYATALEVRNDELHAAHVAISQLRAEVDWLSQLAAREPVVVAPDPVVSPDLETPPAVEAALREQIIDLRSRLDHAAELVDHVVRRLVAPGSPPPAEPTRTRLQFPLVRESFADAGTPIDLIEEYPLLRARPGA